jgi:hypothetical protein
MRQIILMVLVMAAVCIAQSIAQDSCDIAVELREKYGPVVYDTGTVIMIHDNCFVITHRDASSTWYPVGNYSISKITKLKEDVK